MKFFEQEFQRIFKNKNLDLKYFGKNCMGILNTDNTFKAEFIDNDVINVYDAIKVSILNPNKGLIDSNKFLFEDILGKKKFKDDFMSPHIWIYNNNIEWYGYKPTSSDYLKIGNTLVNYLDFFNNQSLKINNIARNSELFENVLGTIGDLYEDEDLYNMLYNSFGMTNKEIEDAGFELQDYYNRNKMSM